MREPIRITSPEDDEVQIPFIIPISGRAEPLSFNVPAVQFLPFDVAAKLDEWVLERNEQVKQGTEESKKYKTYDATKFLLSLLLPAEDYADLERLTVGQWVQIDQAWDEQSRADLGKSGDSSDS